MTPLEKVTRAISGVFDLLCIEESVTLDLRPRDHVDDLGWHEIIMAIEDGADFELSDEEAERARSVADLVALVEAHALEGAA